MPISLLDFLQDQPEIDGGRIGVMGSSLGGILSLLAVALDPRWRCAVDFSGGASQWAKHRGCREMMLEAARNLHAPALSSGHAEPNDSIRVNDEMSSPERVTIQEFPLSGFPNRFEFRRVRTRSNWIV